MVADCADQETPTYMGDGQHLCGHRCSVSPRFLHPGIGGGLGHEVVGKALEAELQVQGSRSHCRRVPPLGGLVVWLR